MQNKSNPLNYQQKSNPQYLPIKIKPIIQNAEYPRSDPHNAHQIQTATKLKFNEIQSKIQSSDKIVDIFTRNPIKLGIFKFEIEIQTMQVGFGKETKIEGFTTFPRSGIYYQYE